MDVKIPKTATPMNISSPSLYLTVQYARRPRHWPTKTFWEKWMHIALEDSAHVTLRLVDQEEGQLLNNSYRGKDYPTNVLSFPYEELNTDDTFYGDLVLCVPVVEKEAQEQRKSLEAHAAHLVIHGMLHLQGYDHETEEDAQEMEQKEIILLEQLGYPNPYDWHLTPKESAPCRG
jgi:probable rRNA maturation factor